MKEHADDNKNLILSIGMIVKNEEKVLERCLKSLKPLMEAIPSELIIADTGSIDSTVNIAKRYTDKFYHFEWINDFAAARNSTIEKATGQWYMFIDADEYLDENITELVDFFTVSELYQKNKCLEITIRNYTDNENNYVDAIIPRLFKIDDGKEKIRFEGAIHEGINARFPMHKISTIFHHTGYAYKSSEQIYNKRMRNYELMKEEFKKNPKDLRILSHLIIGTGSGIDDCEKEKYIKKALKIAKEDSRQPYRRVVYLQAVIYYKDVNPEYGLELCDEYEREIDPSGKYIAGITIALTKSRILSYLTKYELAYKSYERYFSLYDDYKNGKLNDFDLSAHPIDGITESEYIQNNCLAAIILSKMSRTDEAFKLLQQFPVNKLDGSNFKNVLGSIREISKNSEHYEIMTAYYNKVIKCDDDDKKSLALYMMESTYYSIVGEDKRKLFAQEVISTDSNTKFGHLMKLVLNQNEDSFIHDLTNFIDSIENWKDGYSEAIYLAVKNGLDISKTVDKMNSSDFRERLEIISINHDDFAEYVLNYGVPESYTNNIKRFFWITSLYEKASYRSFELNDQKRYALYLKFVELLGEYVSNIYNPELLKDESDVEVLPPLHQFGYYMYRANQILNEGNAVEYIREMKKALDACESMREIVQFMLDEFKKRMGM